MAKGKVLNRKPYAGNPHVLFDEREVAPAAWMAKAAVAAICTGITLAAHAENFVWRGTTDNPVWDTTSQNWANDASTTTRKMWVNNSSSSNPKFDSQGATDITVDAAGVEGFEFDLGGTHTLSGGPVTMAVIDTNGGDITIYNTVNCTNTGYGLRMFGGNGTLTVGDGGYLNAYFSPFSAEYAGKVIVLTNGTFRATFNRNNLNNSNKPTIYFNGGALLHTWNDWQNHVTFGNTKMVIGEGGMVLLSRASSGNTYLPRPIGTDTSLPTDGGIILSNLSNYVLFEKRANHTYRGGLHIKSSTSDYIGIEEGDSSYGRALGAVPATPTDDIFFESPSNTVCSALVGHGGGVSLDANRNLRIGNGVTAQIGTYNSGSSLTIKGTFSCENPQTGFLVVNKDTGTTTLNPGAGRTNHIGRLWVSKPLTIASGTTLLEGNTGVVDQDNSLHVRNGGTLTISGGEVITTGSGDYATQNGTLVISGGLLDLGDRDFLHAHKSPATTTVRNGGRLHVKDIRIADDGCRSDASKSVLNLETGGVVRVTRDIYIHRLHSGYKATVNCNGGTIEWANTVASHNCPVGSEGDHSLANTVNGLTWNVKEGGLVVSNDCHCYFRSALVSGAANDGGVTKWGSATFALFSQDSTFNGPVTIMQGEFRAGNPGVIPATCTARVAAGASFSPNTYPLTLARIEGSGTFKQVLNNGTKLLTVTSAIAPGMGTNTVGTLTVSDGPINIADGVALEIDVDAGGNSDCFSCPCELDLSKMSLRVNDLANLNTEKKYVIASNLMDATGDFASSNLPNGWFTRYDAAQHKLILYFQRGTVIMMR